MSIRNVPTQWVQAQIFFYISFQNFVDAFASGDILQVLLIAILFGIALLLIPKHMGIWFVRHLKHFLKYSLK